MVTGGRPEGLAGAGRWAAVRSYFRRTRSPLWLELFFIAWLCWLYDDINSLSPLRLGAAFSNARRFLRVEQFLHLDPEAGLDHWLAGHHTLGWIAGTYYDNFHFVVTLGIVGLLWWRFPEKYRPLRTSLVLTNVIAMAVFWLLPTAPPRLLDPKLYIDIVGQSHSFGSWHSGRLATAANQYAAFPSLHISWAVWSALALWRVLPRTRWSWLLWLYPVLTSLVVMSTGNHFLTDVVAGALVLVAAQVIADRWGAWWTAREARRALHEADRASDGRSVVGRLDPPTARLPVHQVGPAGAGDHLHPGPPPAP